MRLLSTAELSTEKGISFHRSHLFKLVRAGRFPKPVKIGENRNAWVEAEVDAWIKGRIAARDKAA
jgi:prophage regulatory protein